MKATNALQSLYGGARKRALAGNVGAPKKKREQTVLTPPWLIAELAATEGSWPILDPCTTPENPLGCKHHYSKEEGDGLVEAWGDDTSGWAFWNPPYDDLNRWMWKAVQEFLQNGVPSYGLIPFRPHREWFCESVRGSGAKITTLRPLAFVGHKAAFPAPLCIMSLGLHAPSKLVGPKSKNYVTGVWRLD